MNDTLLAPVVAETYVRTDVTYRLGLVRAYLEWVFFTEHATGPSAALLEKHSTEARVSVIDSGFLHGLPESFWKSFGPETLYTELDRLAETVAKFPTLRMTVGIAFLHPQTEAVGVWARRAVHPQVLLEFETDREIGAGCQIVWRDHVHDYTFARAMQDKREALMARVQATAQPV